MWSRLPGIHALGTPGRTGFTLPAALKLHLPTTTLPPTFPARMQSSGPAQDVPAAIVRLPGIKLCLNSDPNHAGPMQEGTETNWEHFSDDLFRVNEDTKQDLK